MHDIYSQIAAYLLLPQASTGVTRTIQATCPDCRLKILAPGADRRRRHETRKRLTADFFQKSGPKRPVKRPPKRIAFEIWCCALFECGHFHGSVRGPARPKCSILIQSASRRPAGPAKQMFGMGLLKKEFQDWVD